MDTVVPQVGDSITMFGITGSVIIVEPESDWFWFVVIQPNTSDASGDQIRIYLPTDFRTTDGRHFTEV